MAVLALRVVDWGSEKPLTHRNQAEGDEKDQLLEEEPLLKLPKYRIVFAVVWGEEVSLCHDELMSSVLGKAVVVGYWM